MLKQNIQLGELISYCIPNMTVYQGYKYIGTGLAGTLAQRTINLPVHTGIGGANSSLSELIF